MSVYRNNRNITVEDHYPQGGIGEAVTHALCNENIMIHSLAVSHLPRSGKPDELLVFEGIDAAAIVKVVQGL
jgi:transketolase